MSSAHSALEPHGRVSPLRHPPFRAMLLGSTLAFFSYGLLLPVVPLWAVRGGAGPLAAGAATGVFMAATVAAQLAVPAFVRAFGYRAGLLCGALLLGLPSPLLIVSTGPPGILAISAVRGVGFGLLTVCGSALIAELLPRGAVARGSGLYGLAVGLPQLAGLPAGTWLAGEWGFAPVFVVAAVLPLSAVAPMLLLPKAMARPGAASRSGLGALVAATWRPWLPMLAVCTGFGALATFVPIMLPPLASTVALFVIPGFAMLARWVAGHAGDRAGGHGRMLPAGLAAAAAGLAGFALLTSHPVFAVIAVGVFGIGFGVVQNDSLMAMFARSPAGAASVAWNIAFDAGQGLGAVAVGAVVAAASFPIGFGVLAVAATALLPVAVLARRDG